jgi:hypothetical protein
MTCHPRTLTEAIRYYSDAQTCINAVAMICWPDGNPVRPRCNAAPGAQSLLAKESEALELLFMPEAIQR